MSATLDSSLRGKIDDFFYEGMNRRTVLYVYGSAATGHWIAGRSDLDLVILVPAENLALLGEKVRLWCSTPTLLILDGYAISVRKSTTTATHLQHFLKVNFPPNVEIDLIDKWNIKNRSKHLFGEDSVYVNFPEVGHGELQNWAIGHLKAIARSNPKGVVSDTEVLSDLAWSTSYVARMLILSRGHICESKQEALRWLANEHVEIKPLVNILLDEYSKPDDAMTSISSEQSKMLRRFCLRLIGDEAQKFNMKIRAEL